MRITLIVTLVLLQSLSLIASADTIIYNSNGFEAPTFTAGSSPLGQDPSNPWIVFGGTPNAFSVENSMVASGTQAIQATGGGLNDGSFAFPELDYTPGANERVSIQVDIARSLTSIIDNSSPVYAIDIYDQDVDRTSRFGLQQNGGQIRTFVSAPINDSGQVDPTGTGIASQYFGPAIAQNTFVHFNVTLDFADRTVDMSVNGTLLAAGIPFLAQSATTLSAAALEIGTFNNLSADNGYFDNYSVTSVPYLRGDVNTDGIVNGLDLNMVATNWLKTGVAPTGDVNEDGIVNGLDINIIASKWLTTLNPGGGGSTAGAAVPEPGTFALLITGMVLATATYGRRRISTRRGH
jgi:hypothetical protein